MLHHNVVHKNPQPQLHNLIANGGKIIIVGGRNKTWNSYRGNPQLEFWSGDDPAEMGRVIRNHNNSLPSNTHAILISKFISHSQLDVVMSDARKKRIVMFANLTDNEIFNKLDEIIGERAKPVAVTSTFAPPAKPIEAKPVSNHVPKGRGQLKPFAAQHDVLNLTITESAKALLEIAKEKGITTTLGSLIQSVKLNRKALGIPGKRAKVVTSGLLMKSEVAAPAPKPTPKPAPTAPVPVPDSAVQNLLATFDDAIAGLQLTRDAVAKMAVENRDLRGVVSGMAKLLKGELA